MRNQYRYDLYLKKVSWPGEQTLCPKSKHSSSKFESDEIFHLVCVLSLELSWVNQIPTLHLWCWFLLKFNCCIQFANKCVCPLFFSAFLNAISKLNFNRICNMNNSFIPNSNQNHDFYCTYTHIWKNVKFKILFFLIFSHKVL